MRPAQFKVVLITWLFCIFTARSEGQVMIGNTPVDTASVITGLDTPWEILWGPDNHIWFTERPGTISRLDPETGVREILATVPEVHEEVEAGLLGLALHPSFPDSPYVYTVYNYLEGSQIKERVVRFTYSNNKLINEIPILEGINGNTFHEGSRLAFGPDKKLYVTTGDAGNTASPQDTSSLNGKILRMNPDGSIPDDNPFPGKYVWTLGHRNPEGLVFSPDGKLYSSEHGPANDDELNLIEKGRNYGWPNVMGFCDNASETNYCILWNVREPLYAWTPTLATAGIDYYNFPAIPEWQHSILLATLKDNSLVSLKLSTDGLSVMDVKYWFKGVLGRLRDICISPDGRIFIATSNNDGRGTPRAGDDRILEIIPETTGIACKKNSLQINARYVNQTDEILINVPLLLVNSKYSVYNLSGKVMRTGFVTQPQFSLSTAGFAKGIYLLTVISNQQTTNLKLVVP